MSATLVRVRSAVDVALARALFMELERWYREDHDIDIAFQGFADELAGLPGKYAPPTGELILAKLDAGSTVGCIALRPFGEGVCEIKRLYVRPGGRGSGIGRMLGEAIVDAARDLGYKQAVLDTASFMTAAARVYESLGFRDIPAYYANPYPNVRYLGLDL